MSPLLLLALLLPAPQAAANGPAETPPVPSPGLTAALPELSSLPGVIVVGYPVTGRSPRAIRESMNEGRPALADGDAERFDARTNWRYQTRWRRGPNGGCDPSTAEVEMTVTVILPELANPEHLDRRERENWDRYFRALVGHEQNHVRIALAGAEQMRTYMRGAPDCATMQAVPGQVGAAIIQASRTYDAQTRHGRTEGATYP